MALEQHPVPQQISSYQFRLIGDMTLKQFFQLAAGAGIGLLIYGLPLLGIIKWPLVVASVLLGAAFAFLPVQDRPLSMWLKAFVRSIYSPTIFTWQKNVQQEVYFAAEESETPSLSEQGETKATPGDIQAQFGEVASSFLGNLEDAEEKYLSTITGLFKRGDSEPEQQPTAPAPQVVNEVPQPIPAIPRFAEASQGMPPTLQPQPQVQQQAPEPYYRPVPIPPAGNAFSIADAGGPAHSAESSWGTPQEISPDKPMFGQPESANTTAVYDQPVAETTIFSAPAQQTTPFADKPIFQNPSAVEQIAKVQEEQSNESPEKILEQIAKGVPTPTQATPNATQMETPTQANILVGKVLDKNENPVANAIMEIKDEFGRPVRAFKTDKDGKFRIVTPLHDGKYTLYTEIDGYDFAPLQLELQNTIVEPMIVEGKALK